MYLTYLQNTNLQQLFEPVLCAVGKWMYPVMILKCKIKNELLLKVLDSQKILVKGMGGLGKKPRSLLTS